MARDTHTPARSVRVPQDVWDAAKAEATTRGETVTDVVVRSLRRYGRAHLTAVPAGAHFGWIDGARVWRVTWWPLHDTEPQTVDLSLTGDAGWDHVSALLADRDACHPEDVQITGRVRVEPFAFWESRRLIREKTSAGRWVTDDQAIARHQDRSVLVGQLASDFRGSTTTSDPDESQQWLIMAGELAESSGEWASDRLGIRYTIREFRTL